MRVLVTGSAGFIGAALTRKLLELGHEVLGIDNHNQYYDTTLKLRRLELLKQFNGYEHHKMDICDNAGLDKIFSDFMPQTVVNLAAQAGVRYSIEDPGAYFQSNFVGFGNIIEQCRRQKVGHLVYASSSSVYGGNTKLPFSVSDPVNHPLSLYAASKRSNELTAHSYSSIFNLPTTGLRFFTVYGPWGRPDMALFKFTEAILKNKPIVLFNYGNHRRDFTFIDDIVEGIWKVMQNPPDTENDWNPLKPSPDMSNCPWRIYNIGNNKPVELKTFLSVLERELGKSAIVELQGLQPGDVPDTFADVSELTRDFGYKPSTSIDHGIREFVNWYKGYFDA